MLTQWQMDLLEQAINNKGPRTSGQWWDAAMDYGKKHGNNSDGVIDRLAIATHLRIKENRMSSTSMYVPKGHVDAEPEVVSI